MNEKIIILKKLFNLSDEWIRTNKRLVNALIKGDTPGPGPEPPAVTIVFKTHNNETEFNVEANETTINCIIDSTIEGIAVPFTAVLKSENNWCTLNIVNNTLQITVNKNTIEEIRNCTIVVTQQELLGEQKSFELNINQDAAEPVSFDFITNQELMNFNNNDTVLLDYLFNNAPGAEKKNITGGESPVQVLDPKCLKDYNIFTENVSPFEGNISIQNASLLGFTKTNKIPAAAFNGCTKLNKILIPESVTEIEDSAFRYCGSYEISYHTYTTLNVYFLSSTPPIFGSEAFKDAMFGNIYVPIGAKPAYDSALPSLAQYIQEASIKTMQSWSTNTSFKFNNTLGYYESVEDNLLYDDIMNYINA